VILILYDSEQDVAYWQHVTSDTALVTGNSFKIFVPKNQRIDADSARALAALVACSREDGLQEFLLQLPPSCAARLRSLDHDKPRLARYLAHALATGRTQASDTIRGLIASAPEDRPRVVWEMLGEYAVAFGDTQGAAECFKRADETPADEQRGWHVASTGSLLSASEPTRAPDLLEATRTQTGGRLLDSTGLEHGTSLGPVTIADAGGRVGAPQIALPSERAKKQRRRRFGVVVLCVVLAISVPMGVAVAERRPAPLTVVNLAGDTPLFDDLAVQAEFKAHGLSVVTHSQGSRALAKDPDLPHDDMALVSSDDAAALVQQQLTAAGKSESTKYIPMGTPMVVLTYPPIARLLQALGIAHKDASGVWTFDMRAYINTVFAGKRWTDIPGNTDYQNNSQILLATTDPSQSGSSELFLMILSYLFNNNAPVTEAATVNHLLPQILPFFQEQGDMQTHTPVLEKEFLTGGMDRYPMIFAYENDYLSWLISGKAEATGLVVMYPNPTVLSETAFVSWTKAGDEVNELLETDSVLIALEEKNGQHTQSQGDDFAHDMAAYGATVPNYLNEVPPPTDAILEKMIEGVQLGRQQAGSY
jgi:hypothetical protein